MSKSMRPIMSFFREEEGVTAIEYGLIAALIAVVIVAAVKSVGADVNSAFELVHTKLTGA
ncbi:MAG: Flp family type IVb pilin [bacterium]|nr:Flp family type IVb pilin [bacterium]